MKGMERAFRMVAFDWDGTALKDLARSVEPGTAQSRASTAPAPRSGPDPVAFHAAGAGTAFAVRYGEEDER